MKKILSILIIFIFSISWVFAYTPTQKDYKILNNIYPKIDRICKKSQKNCKTLKTKIDKISIKYKRNERIYFLLTELSKHLTNELKLTNIIIVTKVTDWDTIHFKKDWKDYVTRLIWIDAPENSTTRYWYTEKLWDEAKKYLEKLILWKQIQIEYDSTQARTDKYWRHLIYIFYNWENINKKMIEEGLAKEYTYNKPYKYQKEFLEAQEQAKKLKKWIWGLEKETQIKVIEQISDHNDTPTNTSCNIKWNINSKWEKIYHFPGCRSYNQTKITPSKWERWFCSKEEAEKAWWRMAWNCN